MSEFDQVETSVNT